MRTLVMLAAIFIGTAASAADTPNAPDFAGDWWSTRCSRISLVQSGDRLSGLYTRPDDSIGRQSFELSGYVSGDLIAFVVKLGADGPIGTWAGQHTIEQEAERIVMRWHMTVDVPDEEENYDSLLKSVWQGADTFSRTKFARCR
jgi:Avidin family